MSKLPRQVQVRKVTNCIVLIMTLLAISGAGIDSGKLVGEISYPVHFEIEKGSYAWIVTESVCEKVSTLKFEWDSGLKTLKVNGEQIYPGLKVLPKKYSEEELEKIYGDYEVVREMYGIFGSWEKAVREYKLQIEVFRSRLREEMARFNSGEISESEVREFFEKEISGTTLERIFSRDKGVEFKEDYYVVFTQRPGGVTPFPDLYEASRPLKVEKEGSKEIADQMVKRIVTHFKIQPDLPHAVIIENGGPCQFIMGKKSIENVEDAIEEALAKKSLPQGPSVVPEKVLSRMIENAKGGER